MSAEVAPSLRMIAGVLGRVEEFFADSGCRLSPEQTDALLAARDSALEQIDTIDGAA